MASRGRPRIVEEVLHRLLRSLASGKWTAGMTIPPSRQLATMFNVSPGTIRRALGEASRLGLFDIRQRRPVIVCEGAQQRAERLVVRMSVRRSASHVAMLLPEYYFPLKRNTFYALLTTALTHEMSRRGFQTTVIPWSLADRISVARSLPHKGVDAAMFIGCLPAYTSSLFLLYEQGFPFVVFNQHIPGLLLPTVLINVEQAAIDLASRLMTLGHRNLCLVTSTTSAVSQKGALDHVTRAWLGCLHESGVLGDCTLPTYFPYNVHQDIFAPAFVDMMHGPNPPTAVVFEYYQWAKAFLNDPRFADLRVPDHVSLATIGPTRRIPSVSWCPPMTSADIDYQRTAQCLVEALQRVLAGETDAPNIQLRLKMTLTDSIGRVPDK
jgi:DNA-binding LacI/PurR family transcriptional regulator